MQAVETEVASLKKSVSDGKTLVAGAITDKGITTATDAAFATMADNISQISTLAADTADATATAAQILTGKRAYVKGAPVVGTMPNNGGVSAAISSGLLKAGYTTGGVIANLRADNVKQGINIGGVVGSYSGTTITLPNDIAVYNALKDYHAKTTNSTWPWTVYANVYSENRGGTHSIAAGIYIVRFGSISSITGSGITSYIFESNTSASVGIVLAPYATTITVDSPYVSGNTVSIYKFS